MAEVHDATIVPTKLELLESWIGSQRWYAAKGRQPRLVKLTSWRLDDPAGEVGVETIILADTGGAVPVVYQVPLTYRGAPLAGAGAALVGTMEHSVLGTRWVYDGPHDPVYAAQLLSLIEGGAQAQAGSVSDTAEPTVAGHPEALAKQIGSVVSSRVLTGEQSNTSVIYEVVGVGGEPEPLICKVFRTLQAGDNPDVVVQGALAQAGSTRVPGMVGHVSGQWPDPTTGSGAELAHGHLAFAQEFFAGTRDAWRVALEAVRDLTDFTGPARDLGATTAEVHATLALALPTEPATPEAVASAVAAMRGRWVQAVCEVPALAAHESMVEEVFAAAADASWPALQRIHGDYHLGQVLQVPGRGWVLLDFEGEPLRALSERSRPDVAVRDVAGMLRSFDYAAAAPDPAQLDDARRQWAADVSVAFLDGYTSVAGRDPRDDAALLTAYSLDKALYEVVYEVRNRPTWVAVPLTALDRMLDEYRRTR